MAYDDNDQSPKDAAALIAQMSLNEKVRMLSGDLEFWSGFKALLEDDYYHTHPFPAARCERLGLTGLHFIDGPRGVVLNGKATSFPVSMARGASWDVDLEERIGDAIGKELRSHGGNLFGGVCINLLRHPAWGRAQETYGEDTVHLGQMGAALTRGVERHAVACVKHYALNSMENARFSVDVSCPPRPLHEVYLPHFKDCVDAGAGAVMSAYNAVNGEWAGQNHALLTDTLKKRWGFDGVVLTDFIFGMRDAEKALAAGLDLEMPYRMVWGDRLMKLVQDGVVSEDTMTPALTRLIEVQQRVPQGEYPASLRACSEHTALSREAAEKSIVLLKNDGLLPLPEGTNIVTLGKLAAEANLGDHGSSDGRPEYVVTPLQGLKDAMGEDKVLHFDDLSAPGAKEAVKQAGAVLVVAGYTFEDEGEYIAPVDMDTFGPLFPPPPGMGWIERGPFRGLWNRGLNWFVKRAGRKSAEERESNEATFGSGGDRTSLRLKPQDEELITSACELNAKTAVAIMAGSAVIMEAWKDDPATILMLWYPGMEGGHALASVLRGEVNPSGRLPFVVPTTEEHLPFFDAHAASITYDLWHGYRLLDRNNHEPAFPFGFGLSYTRFALHALDALREGDDVIARFEAENLGERSGALVAQLYTTALDSKVERPMRELKGFRRIELEAGERRKVEIRIPASKFAYFDEGQDDFIVERTSYRIELGQFAGDPNALTTDIELG